MLFRSFLRDQTAIFIPKGYYVVLEVHYLGNGKEDEEQTKIQFYGYPEGKKPAGLKRIRYFWTITTEMEIPPGTRDFVVPTKSVRIQKNMRIVTLLAHLHMRGTAARLIMTDPQGRERIVTSIPNFDFNWQSGAKLEPDPPIFVPAGSRLRAECTYDNSAQNPRNPDPEKFIKHGQTLDRAEMCKFMIAYYEE